MSTRLQLTHNLDNNNFGQLYVFQEVEVEDNWCGDFAPKPHKGIELVLFMQCCLKIMSHGRLEMIRLQVKHVSWKQWKNILVQSTNLMRVTKSHFQCAKVKNKVSYVAIESTTQYCGYTTPNVIMISYFGNHISSFEISFQIAPSHSCLTLFIAMSKTIIVTS